MDELTEGFVAGDEAAVAELYKRYSGAVFTVGMSILGDRDLASEVVQSTFVNAWRAAASFDPQRSITPWLYAIARRAAIDVYRRERRQALPVDELPDVAVLPPGIEDAWEAFEVRCALDGLAPDEREVMRLSHFEGLTHAEIAEKLSLPLGTVKSRSHRAHGRLATALAHLAPHAGDGEVTLADVNQSDAPSVMPADQAEGGAR